MRVSARGKWARRKALTLDSDREEERSCDALHWRSGDKGEPDEASQVGRSGSQCPAAESFIVN